MIFKNLKTNNYQLKTNLGFGLVEVVVGVSLIFITLVGLVSTYGLFLKVALKNTAKIQASYLVEEGLEAMRSIRDEDWDTNVAVLSLGVEYGFTFDGSQWTLDTTPTLIDGLFYRTLNVAEVFRDGNSDIAPTGVSDPNTKLFTVSVSWLEGSATTTKSISAYLSNIF